VAKFRCECAIPCYPETIEVEAGDGVEAEWKAVRALDDCDYEPDCECEKIEKPLRERIDPDCKARVEKECDEECESHCGYNEFCWERCYDECTTSIAIECLQEKRTIRGHNGGGGGA